MHDDEEPTGDESPPAPGGETPEVLKTGPVAEAAIPEAEVTRPTAFAAQQAWKRIRDAQQSGNLVTIGSAEWDTLDATISAYLAD